MSSGASRANLPLCAALAIASISSLSLAQETPSPSDADTPAQAGSAVAPDDVVLLKDGSLIRGTIDELIASESVTIVTRTGKVRTFRAEDVRYAGPSSDMPSVREPAAEPPDLASRRAQEASTTRSPDRMITVLVRSTQADLTLHVRGGPGESSTEWRALCSIPCSAELRPGRYVFGVSSGIRKPVAADSLQLNADTTLSVGHDDSRATRVVGWTILGLGSGIATGLLAYGMSGSDDRKNYRLGGGFAGVLSLLIGLPMGLTFDRAVVQDRTPDKVVWSRPPLDPSSSPIAIGFSWHSRF